VIQDLLDYVRVSNIGDNAHGAATQWAQANIKIKDSFEPLSPSQGGRSIHLPLRVLRPRCVRFDRFFLCCASISELMKAGRISMDRVFKAEIPRSPEWLGY
jgi:hypothetical protein